MCPYIFIHLLKIHVKTWNITDRNLMIRPLNETNYMSINIFWVYDKRFQCNIILMTIFFIVILTWFNCGCYGNQSVINSKSNGQNKLLANNTTLLGEFQKTIGKSKKGKIDTSNIHIHDHSLELVYWDQTPPSPLKDSQAANDRFHHHKAQLQELSANIASLESWLIS